MSGWALNAADVGPIGAMLVALAALVGALAVHFLFGRGRPAMRPAPRPEEQAFWEDAEVAARLREVAARMGLPERVLPRPCPPASDDGDFVWRDGGQFRYRSLERGAPVADHASASLDDVLYHVFRDRSRMHAYLATIGTDEATREARIVAQQRAMLAAADPAWAERFDA